MVQSRSILRLMNAAASFLKLWMHFYFVNECTTRVLSSLHNDRHHRMDRLERIMCSLPSQLKLVLCRRISLLIFLRQAVLLFYSALCLVLCESFFEPTACRPKWGTPRSHIKGPWEVAGPSSAG